MRHTGTVVRSIGSDIYPFATVIDGIALLISDGEDQIRDEDIGRGVVVEVTPSDPFCGFICFMG